MLNRLHADILCKITSLLYAHTTFKLVATGCKSLIFNLRNGGVDDLDFIMPIAETRMFTNKLYSMAHCPTKLKSGEDPFHPTFWIDFKHIRRFRTDYNVPLPPMSLLVSNHIISKLSSLSIHSNTKEAWPNLMTVASGFQNLKSLTFGGGCDNTLPLILPEPMKSTLTHLNIGAYNLYKLSALPPNLTFLQMSGRILDFEENDGDAGDDELHGTTLAFPENLDVLNLIGLGIGRNAVSFNNDAFYKALPINLSSLHVGALANSMLVFNLDTFGLPRNLKHLAVFQSTKWQRFISLKPVSIAGLPSTLESWIGDEHCELDTMDAVHLPQSLKILDFGDAGFVPTRWPNVVYPIGGQLRIFNVVGCDADWGDWGNNLTLTESFRKMIHSVKHHISSPVFLPNCREMHFMAVDSGVHFSPSLFPPTLTLLKLSTNFRIREYDAKQMFDSFPPTLTKLVLIVQIAQWSKRICDLDLAVLLPSLQTLEIHHAVNLNMSSSCVATFIDGEKQSILSDIQKADMRGVFAPMSLPRTLTEVTLRSMTLNIASILKLLPPCIEKCDIYGNVEEDDAKAGFMPPYLGSSSLKGISLSLTMYKQTVLYTGAKKPTLELIMFLIRSGNRHINSVHVQWKGATHNMPEADEHCCDSYYKRIEHE